MFDLNRDTYGVIEATSSRFCPEELNASDFGNGAGGVRAACAYDPARLHSKEPENTPGNDHGHPDHTLARYIRA
jgi:hypothetical protein